MNVFLNLTNTFRAPLTLFLLLLALNASATEHSVRRSTSTPAITSFSEYGPSMHHAEVHRIIFALPPKSDSLHPKFGTDMTEKLLSSKDIDVVFISPETSEEAQTMLGYLLEDQESAKVVACFHSTCSLRLRSIDQLALLTELEAAHIIDRLFRTTLNAFLLLSPL